MTEIERQLLAALENLQTLHAEQLRSFQSELEQRDKHYQSALDALQKRLATEAHEREVLAAQVRSLSSQVASLAKQLQLFSGSLSPSLKRR
ncbi:TPA: hypothetical protein L8T34_005408 [Klebsiella pneumoniae]|nr:hypothetical protein [Klebsiella pneumoniae]